MKQASRFEEMANILDDLVDELPEELLDGLNGGILLLEEIKYHPESIDNTLVVAGGYQKSVLGYTIVIYYGSMMELYGHLSHEDLREKLKGTLYHELTHHLETMAGDQSLVIEDYLQIEKYKQEVRGDESDHWRSE